MRARPKSFASTRSFASELPSCSFRICWHHHPNLCFLSVILGLLSVNIAVCELKLKNWELCKRACDEALEIDPGNIKALYRSVLAFAVGGVECCVLGAGGVETV